MKLYDYSLTERAVLLELRRGKSPAEIAVEVGRSLTGVNRCLRILQKKVGVKHRFELIAWAHLNPGATEKGGKWARGLGAAN
jgi:DNA-binding CsgD family transcriptional regulator